MYAGEKTLKQISSESELSIDSTRDCLCALLQHDLVMEVDGRGGDASKKKQKLRQHCYTLNHQKLLLRTYIPRMLKFIGENHGEDAELLVQQMAVHGRVRLSMLERYMQAVDETVSTDQVRRIFEDLLADHLVTIRLSATSGTQEDVVSIQTAGGVTLDPFAIPEEEEEESAGKRSRSDGGGGGAKRARLNSGATAAAADVDGRPSSTDVYWVINYRQFMRHFRNEWVIEHIITKIDRTAGDIVKALLGKDLLNTGQCQCPGLDVDGVQPRISKSLEYTDGDYFEVA